jgi:hypothetical protein
MADPHSPVAWIESGNEESKNERSLGSYESPFDPHPPPKRQRSFGPKDEDYVSEEEVYKH